MRAVHVLLNEEMIDEARQLLERVNSECPKGQKEVLAGYIYALQIECEKSKKCSKSPNHKPECLYSGKLQRGLWAIK